MLENLLCSGAWIRFDTWVSPFSPKFATSHRRCDPVMLQQTKTRTNCAAAKLTIILLNSNVGNVTSNVECDNIKVHWSIKEKFCTILWTQVVIIRSTQSTYNAPTHILNCINIKHTTSTQCHTIDRPVVVLLNPQTSQQVTHSQPSCINIMVAMPILPFYKQHWIPNCVKHHNKRQSRQLHIAYNIIRCRRLHRCLHLLPEQHLWHVSWKWPHSCWPN